MPTRGAAKLLGVSRWTIWHWATAGKLPGAVKIGRSWRIPWSTITAIKSGELVIDPSTEAR